MQLQLIVMSLVFKESIDTSTLSCPKTSDDHTGDEHICECIYESER